MRNGRWDFISVFIAYVSLSLECTVESRNHTVILKILYTKAEGGPSVTRLRQGCKIDSISIQQNVAHFT